MHENPLIHVLQFEGIHSITGRPFRLTLGCRLYGDNVIIQNVKLGNDLFCFNHKTGEPVSWKGSDWYNNTHIVAAYLLHVAGRFDGLNFAKVSKLCCLDKYMKRNKYLTAKELAVTDIIL